MLRLFQRQLQGKRLIRNFSVSSSSLGKPPTAENGLIYGEFTQEEYERAAKYVKEVVGQIEKDVKKDYHVAENFGKIPSFPPQASGVKIDLSNLSSILSQAIKTTGPIPLSSFMRQCLTHPEFGYYTTRDPLGSAGDFITSPEISSMFGEMIGVWLFSTWKSQDSPSHVQVIEFGPGKGTLMNDMMRAFNELSENSVDIEVVMIEASTVLRRVQWKLLCDESNPYVEREDGTFESQTKWGNKISWVDTEKDIVNEKNRANYILAHEFFDALPIQQFHRTEKGWREYLVESSNIIDQKNVETKETDKIEATNTEKIDNNSDFHLTLTPHETPSSKLPLLNLRYSELPVGSRIELCPDASLYVSKMSQMVNANDTNAGACLIIDYGKASIPENTLRGIKDHKFVSPFIDPGNVDLSADVDFGALAQIAEQHQCRSFGPIEQGVWLHQLGIHYRANELMKVAETKEEKTKIGEAYIRLVGKEDEFMGSIYKFMCLLPESSELQPVGFELDEPSNSQ